MSVRALFVVGRNRGVADRDDIRARKARTAVIGGVGRAAFDVHVVAAVAAIPLKSVLLVVLNGEIRAILQVKLIVATEINGMNVAGTGAVHGERSAIERERGILARAHRHPFPLGGIRSGANAGHACIDVLEHKRVAPKGNALVGELQRVAIAVDGEVLVQIKARSLGMSLMVAPSVFLAAASASSKVAYWVPLNSATEAPFLAPAEALAATGAEEGVVAADSAEEATGVPDSFADAASTWGLATVLTEDASTAGSETEAKPSSAKA